MKRILMVVGLVLLIASFALAGAPKSYQVTGPVLEFDGDNIIVQSIKDKTNWQLAVGKDTKITGEVKKGAKVEIHYTMIATSIEIKEPAKEKPAKPAAKEAPKKK
jgi:hypothetical protein